ncbi:hypothetical protein CLV84_1385 [Neolewinella xylanilytica]|uniref:Uncharacterized protein n=1 Tax=Neolewinella xylanilytica TaxID=1514080 RepID=A0A2S6IAA1_9BACT|nr:hypothetical protein CLV84_1385 [Neolewinella xylanilytica]
MPADVSGTSGSVSRHPVRYLSHWPLAMIRFGYFLVGER